MKRKRFPEEQIIKILQEAESGVKTADLCRKYGMSDATFYNWKSKYGGLSVNEVRRLKTLEDENRRLKHIVADLTLDKQALKAVLEKNF
jgi:putative transposase